MPNNILHKETLALRSGKYFGPFPIGWPIMENLMLKGWVFYAVDQSRGRCYYRDMDITIPKFVLSELAIMRGRAAHYILHECAHALVMEKYGFARACEVGHGKEFMEILVKICPPELLIYEMTYKPRNLVKAGAVFCPDSLDF